MGAGLGSSAALSTSLSLAFLLHFTHLVPVRPDEPIPSAQTDYIDSWAFLAEKVIHGNPSGIDNAVSVRGGAVAFRRQIVGKQEGSMEAIKSFVSSPLFFFLKGIEVDLGNLDGTGLDRSSF